MIGKLNVMLSSLLPAYNLQHHLTKQNKKCVTSSEY